MALSQSEIYTLARKIGLSPARAKVAAAIAMAESGGNPNAHNAKAPDDSWGLWQINMIGSMGPARRAEFGLKSDSELTDPIKNAKAMSSISKQGQNFNPWSTYKNKSYEKFLGNPVKEDMGLFDSVATWMNDLLHGQGASDALPDVGGAVSSTAGAITQIVPLVTATATWVSNPQNWIRVAFVIGGSVIVIAGTVMIIQSSSAGKKVVGTAAGVAGKALPI